MITERAVAIATTRLSDVADPEKAGPMAAYLKTDMPFYGVQKAQQRPIVVEIARECPPASRSDYVDVVRALWGLDHREEKYLALGYARAFDDHVVFDTVDLYRDLIVDGAWWDLVDEAAIKLVGRALFKQRAVVTPIVEGWIADDDLWVRRTSIICQIGHKNETDTGLLTAACAANLDDTDFFIRKAIGWALRDFARTDPDWVRAFVAEYGDSMSGLSRREATKHL